MCKFMVKELRKNALAAGGTEEVGLTQFLAHKSTLLSTLSYSSFSNYVLSNAQDQKQVHAFLYKGP